MPPPRAGETCWDFGHMVVYKPQVPLSEAQGDVLGSESLGSSASGPSGYDCYEQNYGSV